MKGYASKSAYNFVRRTLYRAIELSEASGVDVFDNVDAVASVASRLVKDSRSKFSTDHYRQKARKEISRLISEIREGSAPKQTQEKFFKVVTENRQPVSVGYSRAIDSAPYWQLTSLFLDNSEKVTEIEGFVLPKGKAKITVGTSYCQVRVRQLNSEEVASGASFFLLDDGKIYFSSDM